MSTYFARAKATAMGGSDRVVGVTGQFGNGLLRVVDVDMRGNPIGEPSYMPANQIMYELYLDSSGYLVESLPNEEQEIDWEAHADQPRNIEEDEEEGTPSVAANITPSKPNPAMAAFPELQGE